MLRTCLKSNLPGIMRKLCLVVIVEIHSIEHIASIDAVRSVLLNESNCVERKNVRAGSFTIMRGRYTLHRVTENLSPTARYSAVLSYEDKPGVKLDVATRKRFFGNDARPD